MTRCVAIIASALLSIPAHADAPDPAPTLSIDAATHATTVTGPHHLRKVALNLHVIDWWLSGGVTDTDAGDVQLDVDAHLTGWAALDHATDAAGTKLTVTVLKREADPVWPKKVLEHVAVTIPRPLADKARREGMGITLVGSSRSVPILVPAQAMAAFLDGYDKAAGAATPVPAAASPPPPAPAAISAAPPSAQASPAAAPSSPVKGAVPPPPAAASPAAPPSAQASPAAATSSPVKSAASPIQAPPSSTATIAAPAQAKPAGGPADIPPAPTSPIVSLPGQSILTSAVDAADPPATASDTKSDGEPGTNSGTWVPAVGLQFVPTSSGAMVLAIKPGSIADAKGIGSGDFIDGADGVPIKTQNAADIATRIAGAKTLHMIAAGDIKIR